MCGPSRNRKQEAAVAEQNRILEEQRQQVEQQLAEQRRLEQERTDKINRNVASIDQAFSGFDDDFYGKASQNVLDYYTPQLQDQFEEAQKQAAFTLADKGLSDSSVAADKAGDLKSLFDRELSSIQSRAEEAANKARADVSTRQSNLRMMAESGASLDSFDSLITPQISQVTLPSNFSALGDIFGTAANNVNTLQQAGVIPDFLKSGTSSNTANAFRIIQ